MRAIRETGVFAVNLVSEGLLHQMNASSAPLARGIDEFAVAGVTKAECETISCPRVIESPATLECRMTQVLRLAGGRSGTGPLVFPCRPPACRWG